MATQGTKQIAFNPVIDEKIQPELHPHLQLLYSTAQNHFAAIQNQASQIKSLQDQVAALTKGK